MKTSNDLLKVSQFDLLDRYRHKPFWTPWGAVKVESLTRISQHEYQLWIRVLTQEELVPYYLKLNSYSDTGFFNILYRWEPECNGK